MADTGQAAGQEVEFAARLTQSGSPLTYADKAAFTAAGWSLLYRAAQAEETAVYTVSPWTARGDGWHLFVLTLVNGQGPLAIVKPSTGTGWQVTPSTFHVAAENTDQDDLYAALLSSTGVATVDGTVVRTDYTVEEEASFLRELTVLESALTTWGYTNDDLTDGTLVLECIARASGNRQGIPNGYPAVTVVTNDVGDDPVLRLTWVDFPSAVASVIEGMEFAAGDADVAPVAFKYGVRAKEIGRAWAITAVGASSATLAGDQRRWFTVGSSVTITGSTGNDGAKVVSAVSYAGGNTTLTFTAPLGSAVADGNVTQTISIPLGKGTITVERTEFDS